MFFYQLQAALGAMKGTASQRRRENLGNVYANVIHTYTFTLPCAQVLVSRACTTCTLDLTHTHTHIYIYTHDSETFTSFTNFYQPYDQCSWGLWGSKSGYSFSCGLKWTIFIHFLGLCPRFSGGMRMGDPTSHMVAHLVEVFQCLQRQTYHLRWGVDAQRVTPCGNEPKKIRRWVNFLNPWK